MFTIVIPTLNNLKYLKFCIESIFKNSKYNHQIIPHVNIGDDGTIEYLKENSIEFTHTNYNAGICKGMNLAANKAKFEEAAAAIDKAQSARKAMKKRLTFMIQDVLKKGIDISEIQGIVGDLSDKNGDIADALNSAV